MAGSFPLTGCSFHGTGGGDVHFRPAPHPSPAIKAVKVGVVSLAHFRSNQCVKHWFETNAELGGVMLCVFVCVVVLGHSDVLCAVLKRNSSLFSMRDCMGRHMHARTPLFICVW